MVQERKAAGLDVTVHLDAEMVRALDAWLDRHAPPTDPCATRRMSIEEAIRCVITSHLGCDRPSTILPPFATGRDLV